MRRLLLTLALTVSFTAAAHADKPRKPKPALPAEQYPLHDAHPKEHVTIAAEPGDTRETIADTRLDYAHHGFMPFRVIVTNDSDAAINLDEARIHFITANDDVVQAATDEDLQRRLFSTKSAKGTKIPLPAPLPSITIHHKPVDTKILADDADFSFPTTTVAPHTTVSGYLYYDIRDVDDPVLEHATLEVRRVRVTGTDKELASFEILLKPTAVKLATSPAAGSGGSKK